jgi:hypothetical protein
VYNTYLFSQLLGAIDRPQSPLPFCNHKLLKL